MTPDTCPTHKIDLIPTRTGTQLVCPNPVCDHWSPNMTKISIPKQASKEDRAKAIAVAAAQKKPAVTTPAEAASNKAAKATAELKTRLAKPAPPAPVVPKKKAPAVDPQAGADEELDATVAAKPAKPAKDPNLLTVSDVARELGIDPKQARAKLRKDGSRAPDGRWPKMKRDSTQHAELIAYLQGSDDETEPKAPKSKKGAKTPVVEEVVEEDDATDEPEEDESDEDEE